MKRTKKYLAVKKNQPKSALPLPEAIETAKKLSFSSFEGSLELHAKLKVPKDVDPKSIKGTYTLPKAVDSKDVKVAVFTSPDKEAVAKDAGADFYNLKELLKNVKDGKVEFDVAIASPDVMAQIASLGKILGPKGLMPNPKLGTVTEDIATAVKEFKQGRNSFRADLTGTVHFAVGKLSQPTDDLVENVNAALKAASEAVNKTVEQAIVKAHLAPTMGPSVEIAL